jgi:Transposase
VSEHGCCDHRSHASSVAGRGTGPLLHRDPAPAPRLGRQPPRTLARTIRDQRAEIEAAIRNGLSDARVEQINTQIRLISHRSFGYHSQQAVIALAMLSLGGLCPPLPGV